MEGRGWRARLPRVCDITHTHTTLVYVTTHTQACMIAHMHAHTAHHTHTSTGRERQQELVPALLPALKALVHTYAHATYLVHSHVSYTVRNNTMLTTLIQFFIQQ